MHTPKVKAVSQEAKSAVLLEKLLVIQLHSMGVPQSNIAKMVGKQKLWVNNFLKAMPKLK